jgi:hypothetical protein
MSVHIFTGPTLDKKTILSEIPHAIVHPPIARDDLFKLAFSAGDTVLIIDGYFESQPSVAHYEIIDLIENGVCVLGASSMGALRAAELQDIGMAGIGLIFEMYLSGIIDGDDEVAILHSEDFFPLSVPMIDLRINLQKLVRSKDVRSETAENILDEVELFAYQERTMTLVKKIISKYADIDERKKIVTHLTPEYSQKRADALEALKSIPLFFESPTLALPKTCYRMSAKKRVLKNI